MGWFSALVTVAKAAATAYDVYTSYQGMKAGERASESSIKADKARIKASEEKAKMNQQKIYRDKLRNIARARVVRAQSVSMQTSKNMAGSAAGQVGGITSTAASNYGFQTNMENLAGNASSYLFSASIFDTNANQAIFEGQQGLARSKFAKKAVNIFG